jgi:hypothetical protein
MWIAKGTLLALWLFGFGTMTWLYFAIYRRMPPNSAVSVHVITSYTTLNPLWWAGLVLCFVVGYAIARSWSGSLGVWIALLVTGLIPAGFLALFLVLIVKLKQARSFVALASLLVVGGLGLARTVAVKKVDRRVFVSAQALAVSCQAMEAAGYDYLQDPGKTYKLTASDMDAVGRCTGYIEGVADEFRESVGSHYHPVPGGRGEMPILIDTFLKRVAEHPEEADFAASTVLHEADNDVVRSCSDCGLGMIVHPSQ